MDTAMDPQRPSASRVMPIMRISRRTRLGRRLAEIKRIYSEALGGWSGLSPIMRERVDTAAQLKALAELAMQQRAEGARVPWNSVIRAARLALSAERSLGIGQSGKHQGPSLASYLKGKKGGAA